MAPENGGELTPTEYIQHHLHNLTAQVGEGDFMTLHVDTLVMAVLMGLVLVFMFWVAVRKPTADGHVTSLEALDAKGEMVIQFFGKRLEGFAERPEWRAIMEGLEKLDTTAAA